MSHHSMPNEARAPKLRFGLKGALAVVMVFGLLFGWLAKAMRQADEQTRVVGELAEARVHTRLEEPTVLGQYVRKRFPSREKWLVDRIGKPWLAQPAVFVAFRLKDEQVPWLADRLKRLKTVKEVHYPDASLTDRGIARLKAALPGINVISNSMSVGDSYFSRQRMGFALGAMLIDASLALLFVVIVARGGWRLLRKKPR